jgi:cation/acetate symporter
VTYERSELAIGLFLAFVAFTLGLSFYLGRKKQSSAGYFAAGGGVPWFVNGVAFAGDYLSAASFLGICGMIAFYGYDGFLYSIGYLAGWVVALLVIAEPVKRLGKFTFADALDAAFQSRGIRLAAAISTLVVSVFYLVPQMVGAGALIQPLFGFPHWVGVVIVGVVVTIIVATAGMASTTWVQFIKGGLLICFALTLTILILQRGLTVNASTEDLEPQTNPDGLRFSGHIVGLPNGQRSTGPLDPISYLGTIRQSDMVQWKKSPDGKTYMPKYTSGSDLLRPGGSPTFAGLRSDSLAAKLNVISLMLALFCGTASLPHILIRYYTVKDAAAARKSTVVGIATIGGFYILTLFLGLGAMTGGSLDITKENMAAPLLARSFGPWLFALVSAVAFTTVLGTVSGLILAASGAVVNDLLVGYLRWTLPDARKVSLGKLTAIAVGAVAVMLGIVFEKFNVTMLVGWAFSVAASANLPALVMVLFWKRTTAKGVIASILTGLAVSLPWILLSGETYEKVYGWPASISFIPFSQPGLVAIPISFAVLVGVSLATGKKNAETPTS